MKSMPEVNDPSFSQYSASQFIYQTSVVWCRVWFSRGCFFTEKNDNKIKWRLRFRIIVKAAADKYENLRAYTLHFTVHVNCFKPACSGLALFDSHQSLGETVQVFQTSRNELDICDTHKREGQFTLFAVVGLSSKIVCFAKSSLIMSELVWLVPITWWFYRSAKLYRVLSEAQRFF